MKKELVKEKVLTRFFETIKENNPVRFAFNFWKGEVCIIGQNMEDLQDSLEEKFELK